MTFTKTPGALKTALCLLLALSGITFAGRTPELSFYKTDNFQIVHDLSPDNARALGNLLESMYDRFFTICRQEGLGIYPPRQSLTWRFFDDENLFLQEARADDSSVSADLHAFYSVRQNSVYVLNREPLKTVSSDSGAETMVSDIQRISHELAHQLLYTTGVQTPGVLYPAWIAEGLATSFETMQPHSGHFDSINDSRARHLIDSFQENDLFTLHELVGNSNPPGNSCCRGDFYAQSWGLTQFLYERDRRAFIRYLNILAIRPPGRRPASALRREFISAFGQLEGLEESWREYLENLTAKLGSDQRQLTSHSLEIR